MAREGEWENISSCAIVGVGSDDAGLGVSTTQCLGVDSYCWYFPPLHSLHKHVL